MTEVAKECQVEVDFQFLFQLWEKDREALRIPRSLGSIELHQNSNLPVSYWSFHNSVHPQGSWTFWDYGFGGTNDV